MTRPTPVTPVTPRGRRDRPPGGHPGGRRRRPRPPAGRRLRHVSTLDDDRAEAGRDWWPLAIGWAAAGAVPSRPALVARPTDTAQVSAVLALCDAARVPVTPGRRAQRGVWRLHPRVRRCRARPVRTGRHRRRRRHLPGGGSAGGHLRARRRGRPSGRPRAHPRALAPVDGPLHRRRMARLSGGGPVLQPLREDRGHGARPRGGPGRRPGRAHRRPGPAVGHRPRPHPALRRQRGHPRRHHRGPVPRPPGTRRRRGAGPSGSPPSPTASTPAGASSAAARPPPSSASTTPPSPDGQLRPARPPTCSSCWTRPTRTWSRPPWPWSTQECAGAAELDVGPGRPLARPPQRRVGPGPAVACRRGRRHRRGRRPGGRRCPACTTPSLGALGGVAGHAGRLVPPEPRLHRRRLPLLHLRRPPARRTRRGRGGARRLVADYYRRRGTRSPGPRMAAGGAISHHHGIGLNRARFLADGARRAFDVLAAVKAALDPHGILNPGKLGLAHPLRRRCPGHEHPRRRRRHLRGAGAPSCAPTPPSSTSTTSRCSPTPRSPGSSSSTAGP